MAAAAWAQEAESGFELRSTVSAESVYSHDLTEEPRDGAPMTGGFQALLYPTWKLNSHWAVSGAIQVHSRPYFPEEFTSQGYGVKTNILNANVSYSQFWSKGSLVVRAGQLTSAFGSFLLRYDPATNPLTGVPAGYGYYGGGIAIAGLAGAQVDATVGPFDMRAQFTNSSPANPRSVFDKDQYANWAGGAGYTIRQGFRVGVSAYRGPYLDRQYPYYFPGRSAAARLAVHRLRSGRSMGTGTLERVRRVGALSDDLQGDSHVQPAHGIRGSAPRAPSPLVCGRTDRLRTPGKVSGFRILRSGCWFSSRCRTRC